MAKTEPKRTLKRAEFEKELLLQRCANLIMAAQPFIKIIDEFDTLPNKEIILQYLPRVNIEDCRKLREAVAEALRQDYDD